MLPYGFNRPPDRKLDRAEKIGVIFASSIMVILAIVAIIIHFLKL